MMPVRRFAWVPLAFALACSERAERSPVPTGTVRSPVVAEDQKYTGSDLGDKELALTFDDGPGPDAVTGELARWLGQKGIKATFFVNGACIAATTLKPNDSCGAPVANAAAVLATIKANGHVIANHTTTHRDLVSQVPENELLRQVTETHTSIAPYLTWNHWFLRAPYGSWGNAAFSKISGDPEMSKYIGPIYWSIGDGATADWDCWNKNYTTKKCGDGYLTKIRSDKKGIVLMHDPHGDTDNHALNDKKGNTVDMVKYVVDELTKEQGWTFKTLDQVPSIAAVIPKCNAACETCTGPDANQCATCPSGHFPEGGVCTACATCGEGTFEAAACSPTANTVCTPCHPSCTTCGGPASNQCLTCPDGKQLASGACVDASSSSGTSGTPCPDGACADAGPISTVPPAPNEATASGSGGGCSTTMGRPLESCGGLTALALALAVLGRRRRGRPARV